VFVEKYAWACFNVIVAFAPTITLVYWVWLFPDDKNVQVLTVLENVVAPLMVLVEVCFTTMPLRLAHVYCPLLVGFGYVGFAIGYQFGGQNSIDGGNYVYKVVSDYKTHTLEAVLFSVVSLVALVGFFAVACGIVWLRDKIVDKFCSEVLLNKYLIE